jgi:hypothetical protein
MNNLNEMEKELRHWTPRRPSAGLEKALFGPADADSRRFAPGLGFRWLAPVTACLLLTFAVWQETGVSARGEHFAGGDLHGSLACSNLLFCTGGGENFWNRVTFDWTKEGQFTSTVRSLTPFWTNNLIR